MSDIPENSETIQQQGNIFRLRKHVCEQKRHLANSVLVLSAAVALFTFEMMQVSQSKIGYFIGVTCVFPAIFSAILIFRPKRPLITLSCLSDLFAAISSFAAAFEFMIFGPQRVYPSGWVCLILTNILLCHFIIACIDLNHSCKCENRRPSVSSNLQSGAGRRRFSLAPPCDFVLPEEVPSIPDYEQLSVRGSPPLYNADAEQTVISSVTDVRQT